MISKSILPAILIFFSFLIMINETRGQYAPASENYFSSPVDHNIILAGSFGELRSTHFHAGLDIKPSSSNSIDSIRCSAEGRVSRIKIQTGGYGRAIYLDHPNGYTTVYAHLQVFNDTLEKFIREIQQKSESYSVDIYPEDHDFIIEQGEVIGLMGNTGRSYAKHLHFEIRETQTEIPVNPAIWGIKPTDNIKPDILSIDFIGLTPDYMVTNKKTLYTTDVGNGQYIIRNNPVKIPAWRCGISVQAFDRMNGANNMNGVYEHKVYVDDTLYYSYKMDAVSFDETKYINSHVDYSIRKNENRTSIRCYKLPGNPLSIYDTILRDGVIKLFKNKPRRIQMIISDFEGNKSTLAFELLRDDAVGTKSAPFFNTILNHETADTILLNGMEAQIPANSLDKNQFIHFGMNVNKENENEYEIGDQTLILFNYGTISLPLPNFHGMKDKAVIAYKDEDSWTSLGGKINEDKISTQWKNGGIFKVVLDTIRPSINILTEKSTFQRGQSINVDVWDSFGDSLDIRVEINGKWHLSPYKEMTRRLVIPLAYDLLQGEHTIEITAKDDRGNVNLLKKTITII